jgi:hypothetical protein
VKLQPESQGHGSCAYYIPRCFGRIVAVTVSQPAMGCKDVTERLELTAPSAIPAGLCFSVSSTEIKRSVVEGNFFVFVREMRLLEFEVNSISVRPILGVAANYEGVNAFSHGLYPRT